MREADDKWARQMGHSIAPFVSHPEPGKRDWAHIRIDVPYKDKGGCDSKFVWHYKPKPGAV